MISPFLNRPAAITSNKLREIFSLARANPGAFNLAGETASPRYETVNGRIAVIEVSGILVKNLSPLSSLIGEISMIEIGQIFQAAVDDPQITAIVLRIDSPGGTVDGTEGLAKLIYDARGKKPVVAVADGIMASAAYWIGAAADRIYIAGKTTEVGSIGVVASHVDVSEQDKMFGEKVTEITAGKYKRIASSHRPLSDDGRAYLQDQVDAIYSIFVETVATYRGRSIPQIVDAADGKIFMGQAAVDRGLVDGILTFDQVLALAGSPALAQEAKKKIRGNQTTTFEHHVFNLCQSGKSQQEAFRTVKEMHPALFADYDRRLKSGGAIGELFPRSIIGGKTIK